MERMQNASVLISGLKGVGVEIAKNVVLSGVKSVTFHDTEKVEVADLYSQFLLRESDIGANRAAATYQRATELNNHPWLNNYVAMRYETGRISEDLVKEHTVVVLTNSSLDEQKRINEITHPNDIALIVADCRGPYAQIFTDFGARFNVVDLTGEQPVMTMIASITQDAEAVVTSLGETRHGLNDGDVVKFSKVRGMTQINEQEFKIKVTSPYTFKIGDTTAFSQYERGGVVIQVKQPKVLSFKPLAAAVNEMELITDIAKFPALAQLHLCYQALHRWQHENAGSLPRRYNEEDKERFLGLTKEMFGDQVEDIVLVERWLVGVCDGHPHPASPFCESMGQIVAQEVMKATSGKFHPIFQWLYYHADACIHEDDVRLPSTRLLLKKNYALGKNVFCPGGSGSSQEAPEEMSFETWQKSIPMWARDPFFFRGTLETVSMLLVKERPNNFEDCVAWARLLWQELFHNRIAQLLHNFPPDMVAPNGNLVWSGCPSWPHPEQLAQHFERFPPDEVTSKGNPVWSGPHWGSPKYGPILLVWNSDKEMHIDFVEAAANLKAEIYGIEKNKDRAMIRSIVAKVNVPAFEPKSGVKIDRTDAARIERDYYDYYDTEGILWDRFEVDAVQPGSDKEMTLQEFIDHFEKERKLEITRICQGVTTLHPWGDFLGPLFIPQAKQDERLSKPVSEVVKIVSKKEIDPWVRAIVFDLICIDTEHCGEDVEDPTYVLLPYVKYNLPMGQ